MKRIAAALALTAMLAAPAGARDHRRHHDRKDDGVGAFLAGAIVAGGLVALLKAKKAEPAPAPVATEPSPEENDAANLCADAVEAQMGEDGREARVERVASVAPREQGGWKIKGDLRVADESRDGHAMRFSCTVKGGEVRSSTVSI